MANILIEQAFKALEDIEDVEVTAKDLYESKEEYNLPKEIIIDAHTMDDLGINPQETDGNEISEILSDYISDVYGFCHYGFNFDVEGDHINVYNIEWDTSCDDISDSDDTDLDTYEDRLHHLKDLYDMEPGDLTADEIKELHDAGMLEEKVEVCEKCGKNPCECLKENAEEEYYQVQFVDEDDEIYDGGTFDTFEEAKEEAIDGYYSEYVGFVIYNKDGDIIFSEEDLEESVKKEGKSLKEEAKEEEGENNYKFKQIENTFKNSQDKTKEIHLYSNEGKSKDASRYLGSIVFYKDGTKQFECRGIVRYIASPEELKYITKVFKEVVGTPVDDNEIQEKIKDCVKLKEEKHVCEKCGKEVCECDKKLQEGPNTTTTISVLDDGEKVIKQVGYSGLTKKIVNGKPVYVVKYAPGYYVKDIEAKNDYEAIRRFLGLNEGINKDLEYDYYIVSYGNPYKAIVLNSKEDALETAKNFNADPKKLGNWEVYHYTKPFDGELSYEMVTEAVEEVAREEYCVLVNGNNEECYSSEEDAIKFARQRFAEEGNDSIVKVLLVKYGPKDEHGDESELGFETIWASHFEESLKEYIEPKEPYKVCKDTEYYVAEYSPVDKEIAGSKNAKYTIVTKKVGDKEFGLGSGSGLDFASEEEAKKEIDKWCSLKESKSELAIKYWVDEEARDAGESELYFGDIKDLEDAKHIADKLFDEYASVEVVKNVDTEDEEVLYGRYPEDESLKEELTKDEKSVSEEHKEEHTVCAKCGSEEVKFNDPETKEPLCADCFEKRSAEFEEEVLGKDKLDESITVNINDEEEVKKAKEEVEKSEKADDEYEQIVDVDAESIDELKDSYVGNVILVCDDCLTPKFIKPELLKKDEETGLYNVGEACPHCGSEKGYKAEGQVAKASVEVDVEKTETTGASEPEVKEEEKVEVEEKEERPLPSAMESKEEPSRLEKVDLNEQRFDRLVNKFVHTTYENVENYKTNNLYLDDGNSLIVEGVITYKSGKEKQAHFKLTEKKLSTAREDVIALTGICEAFNTCEKAFTFRGNLKENKLDLNSLTYNFTTKVLNESKNIKGKVCIKY